MKVKKIYEKKMRICLMSILPAVMAVSCSTEERAQDALPGQECKAVVVTLHVGVCEMTGNTSTRATEQMSPEMENTIKSLAVMEFDNEGLHEKGESTYHFIDFIKGTVDGVETLPATTDGMLNTSLDGLSLMSYSDATLCLVANVTEEQVDDFYDRYREPGQTPGNIRLEQFKKWSLPFEYEDNMELDPDESVSGHIRQMYMFGYYRGAVDPAAAGSIRVELGRLASRVAITIRNDTGEDIDRLLWYHFDNVSHEAYVFPGHASIPSDEVRHTITYICSGTEEGIANVPETFAKGSEHTRYFYIAGHAASNEDEATKLHLFYGAYMLDGDIPADGGADFHIALGNLPPEEAGGNAGGYYLNRNTFYHFTILLKKSGSAMSRSASSDESTDKMTLILP
ncbi:MAG: hypothetical protein DBX40_05100 [Clostridiales bacterium]|nr:MAG: hypothetical protein DBX40_05100 [Clostridiales bacterium]